MKNKNLKFVNHRTQQEIKIKIGVDFMDIMIDDFSKERIKFTYALIEGECFDKLKEALKEMEI